MPNLLPPNATQLERNVAEVNARLGDLPTPLSDLKNPETCPAAWLPWLAQELSVDQWEPGWTETQKRQAIASSIAVHRAKGTIGAVRKALAAIGIESQLQEWFNQIPAAAPYTFRLLVTADQVGFDKASLKQVTQVLDATKNLRSHLTEIVPQIVSSATATLAGVTGIGIDIDVTGFDYSLIADGTAGEANGTYAANGIKISLP